MASKTITADGTTTFSTDPGGRYVFSAAGTFGSGTVTLKWSDGTTDVDIPDGAFTANGAVWFRSPTATVKAVLAGATTPSIIISLEAEKQARFG